LFQARSLKTILDGKEEEEVTWNQIWRISRVYHITIDFFAKNSYKESSVCENVAVL
jgi:hypothetical protein